MRTPYMELMWGMRIVLDHTLEDDRAYIIEGSVLLVGTKEPEGLEMARREARLLVRHGLADVLEWLGQPVVNEPVLAAIRARSLTADYRRTIVGA